MVSSRLQRVWRRICRRAKCSVKKWPRENISCIVTAPASQRLRNFLKTRHVRLRKPLVAASPGGPTLTSRPDERQKYLKHAAQECQAAASEFCKLASFGTALMVGEVGSK